MANTKPVNDNATVTELMLDKAREAWPKGPRLYPIGALTQGLKGELLAPMAELAEAGCVALSNDGVPVVSTEIMRRAMEYASDLGLMVIDHCEDPHLAVAAGINEGALSSRLGLAGQARRGRGRPGWPATCSWPNTCPYPSTWPTSRAKSPWSSSPGPRSAGWTCPPRPARTTWPSPNRPRPPTTPTPRSTPPLRTEADRQAVLAALESGVIDMLATDHAPHARHEKEVEFDLAPCGITGLDTALAVTWSLVEQGELSETALVRAWSEAPATRFNLPLNRFQPGDPADFVLFDPNETWTVSRATLHSKSANTPLLGEPTARAGYRPISFAAKRLYDPANAPGRGSAMQAVSRPDPQSNFAPE